jgi:hypothetical protein
MRFLKDLSQIPVPRPLNFIAQAALIGGSLTAYGTTPTAIGVMGWPVPDLRGARPPLDLGDDPIVGRQICPPMSRLNLAIQRSEDLLVKKVSEEQQGSHWAWIFEVRQGIHWWSGQQVNATDLSGFIERSLQELVQDRGAGLWELPEFKVETAGLTRTVVLWANRPKFGPYIFSGAPFYRPVESQHQELKYECVGLYQPRFQGADLVLSPTRAYRSNLSMPEVFLYKSQVVNKVGGRLLEFKLPGHIAAESMGNDPHNACKVSLDLPVTTMILWNTQSGVTKNPGMRRILTQLTPRGALVRSGTALLAELSPSLVPKEHPGFHAKLTTRAFDIQAANTALDDLGYKRPLPGGLREGHNGKPLSLAIATLKPSTSLPEKVISDAYTAAGIGVHFIHDSDPRMVPDGVLASFSLDWPRASLIGNFHSESSQVAPYWPLYSKELDALLEGYASTLTASHPDFSKLVRIQDLLYDLEPATVIFQHKACVIAGPGLRSLGKSLSLKDPDWFRQLLF